VADNEFIQIVNVAMDKMKEDVLKFMTDIHIFQRCTKT